MTSSSAPSEQMAVKMIAFDLDGTLLNNDKEVSSKTKETLQKIHKERPDIHLVLASGRMTERMLALVDSLDVDMHLIGYNGAKAFAALSHASKNSSPASTTEVTNSSEKEEDEADKEAAEEVVGESTVEDYFQHKRHVLFHRSLPKEILHQILEEAEIRNLYWTAYIGGFCTSVATSNPHHQELARQMSILTSQHFNFLACKEELEKLCTTNLLLFTNSEKHAEELTIEFRKKFNPKQVHFVNTECKNAEYQQYYVEVLDVEANKGRALESLCKELQVKPEELVVFGDGENDIEMFKFAGRSYAMKNGSANAKKSASHITKYTNNEDGVHHELEELIFGNKSN